MGSELQWAAFMQRDRVRAFFSIGKFSGLDRRCRRSHGEEWTILPKLPITGVLDCSFLPSQLYALHPNSGRWTSSCAHFHAVVGSSWTSFGNYSCRYQAFSWRWPSIHSKAQNFVLLVFTRSGVARPEGFQDHIATAQSWRLGKRRLQNRFQQGVCCKAREPTLAHLTSCESFCAEDASERRSHCPAHDNRHGRKSTGSRKEL